MYLLFVVDVCVVFGINVVVSVGDTAGVVGEETVITSGYVDVATVKLWLVCWSWEKFLKSVR